MTSTHATTTKKTTPTSTTSSMTSDASSPAASRRQRWHAAMTAHPGELDLTVPSSSIRGAVPRALVGGRLLSNGPGWTAINGWAAHPFDGHGYVRAFTFTDDGGVQLRARFVQTRVYRDEVAVGHMLYRGFASNVGPNFWQNIGFGVPRNVANTTILRRGPHLLAGWEAGAPHALDATTLQTIGEETFGGAIDKQATLAHMHTDATSGRLLLCSIKNGPKVGLTFRELDDDNQVVRQRQVTIKGPIFAHDFAFTPSLYVVGGNPLRMRVGELLKMAAGASTLLNCLRPDSTAAGSFHLIPRDGHGPVRTIALPGPAFVVHFGNAFERADGTVVIDVCAFSAFEFGEEFGYTGPQTPFDPALPDHRQPQRLYRVEVAAGSSEATWTPLAPHGVDFPRVHPRGEGTDVGVLFGACRADARYFDPFDSIIRVDLRAPGAAPHLWTAPTDVFVGEPIFIPASPDPATTGGHIATILSDAGANESRLLVFDADRIEAGPIAEVPLPLLPVAFHGDWDGIDQADVAGGGQ